MRILSTLFVFILMTSPSIPSHAVATVVYVGSAFPIITPETGDFLKLDEEERIKWLIERQKLLEKLRTDSESLNAIEAEDLIKQIKRDRCCGKGLNGAWYVTSGLIVLTGLVTSAIRVVPEWMGYVFAGASVVNLYIGNRADARNERAMTTQREFEKIQEDLLKDYLEKKRAHEAREELLYWQAVAQGRIIPGDNVEILPIPEMGAVMATPANLRALHTVHGNAGADEVEQLEGWRPAADGKGKEEEKPEGRRAPAAPPPARAPANSDYKFYKLVKVKKGARKDTPKPTSKKPDEELLEEAPAQPGALEVVIDNGGAK